MSEPIKITCDMQIVTCECGSFYAVPHWVFGWNHTCPICAVRKIKAEIERCEKKDRTIASLRGAITRMKRGRP